MNALTYIIPNVLIALILICGIIQGSRRGWKVSLIKGLYTIGLAVGSLFLAGKVLIPAILNSGIDFGEFIILIPELTFAAVFVVSMLIAQLIFTLVKHSIDKKKRGELKQSRKRVVVASKLDQTTVEIDRKATKRHNKALRKEEAKSWRQSHKTSRTFGAIISFITALAVSAVIMFIVGASGFSITLLGSEVGNVLLNCYNNSIIGILENLIAGSPKALIYFINQLFSIAL